MLRQLIRKVKGQKQIRCVSCKRLKTVPNDWHWLKRCPACIEKGDKLLKALKEGFSKKYGMTFEE